MKANGKLQKTISNDKLDLGQPRLASHGSSRDCLCITMATQWTDTIYTGGLELIEHVMQFRPQTLLHGHELPGNALSFLSVPSKAKHESEILPLSQAAVNGGTLCNEQLHTPESQSILDSSLSTLSPCFSSFSKLMQVYNHQRASDISVIGLFILKKRMASAHVSRYLIMPIPIGRISGYQPNLNGTW
ncbi:unnamed protein product [Lactuca saligna]|uniref:Uncharacterized protein n=1 Tax=Lactuca saligna TaxID=75948 RepID=A0AA35VXE3_LACSI|nr:unnamed protein product [Lactuca saligna]